MQAGKASSCPVRQADVLLVAGLCAPVSLRKTLLQGFAKICHQIRKRAVQGCSAANQNQIKAVKRCFSFHNADNLAQPAAGAVADHGISNFFCHGKANARGIGVGALKKLEHQPPHGRFTPTRGQKEKLFPLFKALGTNRLSPRSLQTLTLLHDARKP